jgi:hypothetical protein
MAEEQEKTRRCSWVALGLVLLLIPGILPGGLVGAFAAIKSADALFGRLPDSDLIRRLFALAGVITGLLVTAAVAMVSTFVAGRLASGSRERTASARFQEQRGLEE